MMVCKPTMSIPMMLGRAYLANSRKLIPIRALVLEGRLFISYPEA
jgi:hypothetical protein